MKEMISFGRYEELNVLVLLSIFILIFSRFFLTTDHTA